MLIISAIIWLREMSLVYGDIIEVQMAVAARNIKKEFNFKWVGRDKTGKAVQGEMRRESEGAVRSELLRQSIQPLKVSRVRESRGGGGKIKRRDLMLFSRQLSTMITAGISISQAMGMMASGTKKITMRQLILTIKADIDAGSSFGRAIDAHPTVFNEMYRGLVHSGERSGTLEIILQRLADYQERAELIRSKVKKALMYPVIVLILALLITLGILIYVIPTFQALFEGNGKELPWLTAKVVAMSNGVRSVGFVVFIVIVIAIFITIKKIIQNNRSLKKTVHGRLLRFPLFGKLIVIANSAFFARTLATMYDAGTPIISSLQIVANSTANLVFRDAILEMKNGVSIGQQLNFTMQQSQLFPELVTHMVGVGEESGSISEVLNRVADFYEQELNDFIDGLMSLMEPILIVVLGGIVAVLLVAMYLPLFSMGDAF